MKVLLSIRPEFAEKIFNGKKKFEFRKAIFKNRSIGTVIVYASAPISKVIGEFEIDHILKKEIDDLWNTTAKHSGISKGFFLEYFSQKDIGYAIKIKSYKKYEKPLEILKHFGVNPPQSFAYVN